MFISLSSIVETLGFKLLLIVLLASLICIFVYNRMVGTSGSYTNHTSFMWDLLKLPVGDDNRRRQQQQHHQQQHQTNDDGGCDGGGRTGGFESRGELECRRVAERLTGRSFPKARPSFLKNNITMSNLELDCFNEELATAIEYNGEQHYNFTPYFHRSKESFYNIRYRDDMKMRLCKENGVNLIIVPYTVAIDDIEEYIRLRL